MKEDIIAGLDIGSNFVRLVVGQVQRKNEEEILQIIGAVSSPSFGYNKGMVNSIEDTTSSITECMEKAERLVGVPINSVFVGINDPHIQSKISKGVVAVSKNEGEIDEADVERAIEAAKSVAIPANYEILHVLPIKYSVDNQEDVKDPVGMNGIRLEVEVLIILGSNSQLKNLIKAIHRTTLEIEDTVLAPIALSEVVLSKKQKELGVAVISIGASTTSMSVYEEGNLLHSAILPIGSEHITSDIAIGLRCPINLAERIKLEYGNTIPENFTKKDEIEISDLAKQEEVEDDIETVSQKYIAEIIDARVEEIFVKVDEELKKIDRSGMLPAGVVLAGGGAKLEGIVDSAKKYLRLPAGVGKNKNVDVVIDKVNEPEFLNALGLVYWGMKEGYEYKNMGWKFNIGGVLETIKSFFQKISPK